MKNKSPKELAEEYAPLDPCDGHTSCLEQAAFLSGFTAAEARAEVLKKSLQYYAGEDYSDVELDVFNSLEHDKQGNSVFNDETFCKTAREALKSYEQKESE